MRSWKSIGTVFLLLLTCGSTIAAHQVPISVSQGVVGRPVWTSSGLIKGHAAARRPGVSEYLGIPYAAPPIEDLRFEAPVAYASNGTVEGENYSPDCPATTGSTPDYPGFTPQGPRIIKSFAQQLGNSQSEDCLYLNVWVKPTTTRKKPVLVFFHGGRFTIGGAHSPYYDGEVLANEQEVVVVTLNYRLNIFGFSGAPGLPQNVGLLDQRMAVEWVHHNIAAFGGDPERIKIFGQSAGGASVDYYSYTWTDRPLVNGLISHSGTALSFKPNTAEQSTGYFYHVSATLGCGEDKNASFAVVDCVRQKPYKDLLKAAAKVPYAPSPALPQPVFHPTVDGVTVFNNYAERSVAGKFVHVPYLFTSNDNEAGYYRVNAFAANISLSDSQWNLFNQAAFTCPTGAAATNRAAHGVPTWHARYFGDWDNLRLYPSSGAYHGVDLPMVFGTAKEVSGISNGHREEKFARYMRSAWAAFARDPADGLSMFGWSRYSSKGRVLNGLAYGNQTHARILKPEVFEKECAALNGNTTPGKGAF